MKIKALLLFLSITLILTGCSNNRSLNANSPADATQITSSSKPPIETNTQITPQKIETEVKSKAETNKAMDLLDIENEAKKLMKNYEEGLIKAINQNDFSQVEPYLAPNSSLYQSQKKLVSDLFSQGIKEKLVSYETGRFYTKSDPNTFKLEVVEKVEINYPQKGKVTKDFQWFYTVNLSNNQVKLSDLEKWESYQQDILSRQMSLKGDGYYSNFLINKDFDATLINKLNDTNNTNWDRLFQDKTTAEKNSQMISTLQSKGTDFNLINSELIKMNQEDVYEYTKKITLSYKDSKANEQKLSILLTIVVKEYIADTSITFGQYARIIDIKDIHID